MNLEFKTEHDMKDHDVPWFNTLEELNEYLTALVQMNHTYGTSAYAMSLAAVAAFQFMACVLKTTGFQASCADFDMVRRTQCLEALRRLRHIRGPFKLLTYSKMLYPQYDYEFNFHRISSNTWNWLQEEAKKLLYKNYLSKKKFRLNEILYRRFDFTARASGYSHYEGIAFPPAKAVLEHWKSIASGNIPFHCYVGD